MDAGCGEGFAVDHFASHMPTFLEIEGWSHRSFLSQSDIAQRISCVGIDDHPLPTQEAQDEEIRAPVSIVKADVHVMRTIADNSVDLGLGIAVVRYLPDKLAAFTQGYRVLKPGGVFVWMVEPSCFVRPDWGTLVPPDSCFTYFPPSPNQAKRAWVICVKDRPFSGFRATFSHAELAKSEITHPWEAFDKISVYKETGV